VNPTVGWGVSLVLIFVFRLAPEASFRIGTTPDRLCVGFCSAPETYYFSYFFLFLDSLLVIFIFTELLPLSLPNKFG